MGPKGDGGQTLVTLKATVPTKDRSQEWSNLELISDLPHSTGAHFRQSSYTSQKGPRASDPGPLFGSMPLFFVQAGGMSSLPFFRALAHRPLIVLREDLFIEAVAGAHMVCEFGPAAPQLEQLALYDGLVLDFIQRRILWDR